ncbi:MAG: hypothetical protein QM817_05395 [Archangium sp.]
MNLKRLLMLMTSALVLASGVANAQAKLPLVTFYSVARGDYFSTTLPEWTCTYYRNCPSGSYTPPEPSYVPVGIQGHVYNPAMAQPSGTMPLYHWWSSERADNFLTTNPSWAGTVGTVRDGYFLHRIEGYIPISGLYPLRLYFNPAQGDNATLATWRTTVPSGYSFIRTEGSMLPPDGTSCSGSVTVEPWFARANYVESVPMSVTNRTRFKFTGPADTYRFDYWPDHWYPVRGYSWAVAPAGFPAPGLAMRALLARVTTGRVFGAGGWYEANQWFRALGESNDYDGPCYYYEGPSGNQLQTVFNDDNIGDNGDGATLTILKFAP